MARRLFVAFALLVALVVPAEAGAQATTGRTRPGSARNFDLVGSHALYSRGMNAPPAVYHNASVRGTGSTRRPGRSTRGSSWSISHAPHGRASSAR